MPHPNPDTAGQRASRDDPLQYGEKPMATRNQRKRRAKARRAEYETERREAFLANERAKVIKANLAADNREAYALRDHLGRTVIRRSNAYSGITDSFVRTVQGGGLRECLNLDRPIGDTDRQVKAFKDRLSNK